MLDQAAYQAAYQQPAYQPAYQATYRPPPPHPAHLPAGQYGAGGTAALLAQPSLPHAQQHGSSVEDPIAAFADLLMRLPVPVPGTGQHGGTGGLPPMQQQGALPHSLGPLPSVPSLSTHQHLQLLQLQQFKNQVEAAQYAVLAGHNLAGPAAALGPAPAMGPSPSNFVTPADTGLRGLATRSPAQPFSMASAGSLDTAGLGLAPTGQLSPLRLPGTPASLGTPTPSALDVDLFCPRQPRESPPFPGCLPACLAARLPDEHLLPFSSLVAHGTPDNHPPAAAATTNHPRVAACAQCPQPWRVLPRCWATRPLCTTVPWWQLRPSLAPHWSQTLDADNAPTAPPHASLATAPATQLLLRRHPRFQQQTH